MRKIVEGTLIIIFIGCLIVYLVSEDKKPEHPQKKMDKATDNIFLLEITTDKDEYVVGQEIKIELKITNISNEEKCYNDNHPNPFYIPPSIIGEGYSVNEWKQEAYYSGDYGASWSAGGYPMDTWISLGSNGSKSSKFSNDTKKPGKVKIIGSLIGKNMTQRIKNYDRKTKKTEYEEVKNRWAGKLRVEKTITIKENPEHLKIVEENMKFLQDEDDNKRRNALQVLSHYGYLTRDLLKQLSSSPLYTDNVNNRKELIQALITVATESLDGDLMKGLFAIARDDKESKEVRLEALEMNAKFIDEAIGTMGKDYVKITDKTVKEKCVETMDALMKDKDEDIKNKALKISKRISDWEQWKKRED